jgi:pimeloyl-ACP methyl ester carboxylesterase
VPKNEWSELRVTVSGKLFTVYLNGAKLYEVEDGTFSQVPWGVGALSGAISEPAWKTKPSWYLVATEDKMIPPPAQRFMAERAGATVVEVAGSHAIYVSQPNAVATLIAQAAKGVKAAAN